VAAVAAAVSVAIQILRVSYFASPLWEAEAGVEAAAAAGVVSCLQPL